MYVFVSFFLKHFEIDRTKNSVFYFKLNRHQYYFLTLNQLELQFEVGYYDFRVLSQPLIN